MHSDISQNIIGRLHNVNEPRVASPSLHPRFSLPDVLHVLVLGHRNETIVHQK